MLTGAMLGLIEQAGLDIIVLTEELDEQAFFASRLTRMETLRFLGIVAETARNLPHETRDTLGEIDWDAWAALPLALARPLSNRLRIWVAIKELTPRTVQSLLDYRHSHPQLFALLS